MIAKKLTFIGRVQGVGFRYSVQQLAEGFDVTGYVQNLPDGRVECGLRGEPRELEAMIKAIFDSHLKGFIKEWDSVSVDPPPAWKGFQIIR
jgi:acylphosphatase